MKICRPAPSNATRKVIDTHDRREISVSRRSCRAYNIYNASSYVSCGGLTNRPARCAVVSSSDSARVPGYIYRFLTSFSGPDFSICTSCHARRIIFVSLSLDLSFSCSFVGSADYGTVFPKIFKVSVTLIASNLNCTIVCWR